MENALKKLFKKPAPEGTGSAIGVRLAVAPPGRMPNRPDGPRKAKFTALSIDTPP